MANRRHKWTREEEIMLMEAVRQQGMNWYKIMQLYFKNIEQETIKNKYYKLIRARRANATPESAPTLYDALIDIMQGQ